MASTLKNSKYVTANILLNKVFEVTVTADASKSAVEVTMPSGVDVIGIITGTATAVVKTARVPEAGSTPETKAVVTVTPSLASADCTVYVLIR